MLCTFIRRLHAVQKISCGLQIETILTMPDESQLGQDEKEMRHSQRAVTGSQLSVEGISVITRPLQLVPRESFAR